MVIMAWDNLHRGLILNIEPNRLLILLFVFSY